MAIGRRISVLAGVMASTVALLLPASPASAQIGGPGAQATPVVGVSGTANCPTNVAANQVVYAGPAGPLTIVQSDGACSSFSANSQGTFTVNGAGPGTFSSSCQAGPPPQSSSAVTVPIGTSINGGAPVLAPTVVTTPNTPVVFPGGVAATLNVQTVSGNTVTQTAIVVGGVQIGRVICGAANVYPLAVDVASASPTPPVLPASAGHSSGGRATAALIALAALALVGSQVLIGRRIVRQKGDATA